MTLPTNEHEVFEDCVQKAHDQYGPLLPLQVKNELEDMARIINYDFDEDMPDKFNTNE